jgi:hypothetical protein
VAGDVRLYRECPTCRPDRSLGDGQVNKRETRGPYEAGIPLEPEVDASNGPGRIGGLRPVKNDAMASRFAAPMGG